MARLEGNGEERRRSGWAAVLALALTVCGLLATAVRAGPPPSGVSAVEQRIVELTNAERKKEGLPPLSPVAGLCQAARGHSLEMLDLNYFAHESPTRGQEDPRMRAEQCKVYSNAVGENIFQCTGYPQEVVAEQALVGWMHSPGHRANILKPAYECIGVGVVERKGTYMVTQMFSGPVR